jgi:vacuolar-type H+-ATPase catalytic subunit A/Vma1
MSFEFNIIDDIYELIRQAQLKEDHYKRIDDVKSRKRLDAVIIAEIETKTTIRKTMNNITISISIHEKAEQIFAKTTI